ncbi:protein-tyrosine phosphatase-like protein [Xylariales sp. PMI_506]|nr:protein-tyrosine phosphatase-like protein [Xylariales sp. PMI_506]
MEHRSFSSRFRRSSRKRNGDSSSPGPRNITAEDVPHAPTSHPVPPTLTITTTSTPPRSSHGERGGLHPPKSPFRNFHFRSGKRARSPAPASLPQTTSPALVSQDGIVEHEMVSPEKTISPAQHDGNGRKKVHEQGPVHGEDANGKHVLRPPAFLALSEQEILLKYNDITWAERDRQLRAITSGSPSFKFARVDSSFRIFDRYNNIQPYNNNRVKLQVPEGSPDYINASPIILSSPLKPKERPPHRYIAMQGPLERTTDHTWRMIGEQLASPAVIVMLTETHENNLEKCFQYYPHAVDEVVEVNEHDEFEDGFRGRVKCLGVEEKADGAIEIRRLSLRIEGRDEEMEVYHLLYKKWPDFGVPALEDIGSFFELMRLSRSLNASEENPRIVHCSAGVGRSGTFITLEHLIREVDSGDLERYDEIHGVEAPDLVFETVNTLREQRKMMVQAELQYLFIYQVLRKLWMEKYNIEDELAEEPAAKRLEVGHDPFIEEPGEDRTTRVAARKMSH